MIKPEKYKLPVVLTVAGSDSSGGAGVITDAKAINALGGYPSVAITAVTAQNTQGIYDVLPVSADVLTAQIKAVFDDLTPCAVKVGMLHNAENIEAFLGILDEYRVENLVIDPVMIASSGSVLLENTAIKSLKKLLSKALLITPNLLEAAVLLDCSKIVRNEMFTAVKTLAKKYSTSVLLKGGHLENERVLTDFLYDFDTATLCQFDYQLIETENTHGTGCVLSVAIATHLAKGHSLKTAVALSGEYLHSTIKNSSQHKIGKGRGAVLI